jgi:hypothetical protein
MYLARAPTLKFKILQNVYQKVCERKLLCGVEILGPEKAQKVIDACLGDFCKNILRISACLVNGVAELE